MNFFKPEIPVSILAGTDSGPVGVTFSVRNINSTAKLNGGRYIYRNFQDCCT